MIRVVPLSLLPEIWPHFAPMLKRALDVHPFLSIRDLYRLVAQGHADLIADTQGNQALVMEVITYPSYRVANVVAMGGVKAMGQPLHALIDFSELWAQRHDCEYLMMIGRPGWINFVAERDGHSLKQVQAWKKLEPLCPAVSQVS